MLARIRSELIPSRSPSLDLSGRPATWLALITFGVYCFVYPFAVLLLSFDWMPFGMEWMSSLLLAMMGLSCFGWLWANAGRLGALLGALVFFLGVALEYLGVFTGFPFGTYRYTGVLVPELQGGVPLAIGFAWLLVIVSSHLTVRRHFPAHVTPGSIIAVSLVGALPAVGLDLLLEPVAYHVKNYWQWLPGDGAYYGIPVVNFVAWFVAAAIFNLPLALVIRGEKSHILPWLPVALFVMNVLMFGIVCVAHGFWLAGLIALVLLAAAFLSR